MVVASQVVVEEIGPGSRGRSQEESTEAEPVVIIVEMAGVAIAMESISAEAVMAAAEEAAPAVAEVHAAVAAVTKVHAPVAAAMSTAVPRGRKGGRRARDHPE
jgi:hypothetical protein